MGEERHSLERSDTTAQPLDQLCEEILERHHGYAHATAPRIRAHLTALAEREPAAEPLRAAFAELADLLANHLAKEENILFPALVSLAEAERAGRGRPPLAFPTLLHPIRLMEAEHERLIRGLEEIDRFANGFRAPPGSSDAWRRVMDELVTFTVALAAHLRVENDVLFPRALDLDRRL